MFCFHMWKKAEDLFLFTCTVVVNGVVLFLIFVNILYVFVKVKELLPVLLFSSETMTIKKSLLQFKFAC